MSIREQLFELLRQLPHVDPEARIGALRAYLDSLPPAEAEVAERRALASTQAYAAAVRSGANPKLADFFAAVDEAERTLIQ